MIIIRMKEKEGRKWDKKAGRKVVVVEGIDSTEFPSHP
jgi:hypothetical protein